MGSIAIIPMVEESALKHDEFGCSYTNGPFVVMERYIIFLCWLSCSARCQNDGDMKAKATYRIASKYSPPLIIRPPLILAKNNY